MAGRGPAPKEGPKLGRSGPPVRGDWQPAPGVGWQHGEIPEAPEGLMPASVAMWAAWFGAWYAAYWRPEDVGSIRQLIRLYDQVERGEFQRSAELRMGQDTWGITPKGQQDRRWKPPEAPKVEQAAATGTEGAPSRRYGQLASVTAIEPEPKKPRARKG